jgi:hypothetical protein
MKRLLAFVVLVMGVTLAQGIESQRKYLRNENIKISTLGMSMRFGFIVFGNLNEYLLEDGPFRIGPQPGVTVAQVKASIESAVAGQYKSVKLQGGVKINGSTVIGRYWRPSSNTYWRILYRQGPPGQGVLLSSDGINPKNEAAIGKTMLETANTSVRFFAPQLGQLQSLWTTRLKRGSVFGSQNMRGWDVLRLCGSDKFFFQGSQDLPRLNVIKGWTPNDPNKRVAGRWRVYPISDTRAFLILEYAQNDVRTLDVQFNDGSDGSTPALRLESVPFFVRSPEQIAASKLDVPACEP